MRSKVEQLEIFKLIRESDFFECRDWKFDIYAFFQNQMLIVVPLLLIPREVIDINYYLSHH